MKFTIYEVQQILEEAYHRKYIIVSWSYDNLGFSFATRFSMVLQQFHTGKLPPMPETHIECYLHHNWSKDVELECVKYKLNQMEPFLPNIEYNDILKELVNE